MTKSAIITKAQLYLDDTSELSDAEFSDLFDKIYQQVCTAKPWEFTKKAGADTTSTTLPYVALETDFAFLTSNYNHTDSSYEAGRPVVLRGTAYTPYQVVSWSDRRSYRDQEGYAYIDIVNSRLYFTKQPTVAEAVEYDYHSFMPALTTGQSPAFPSQFHDVIYHGMVVDDFIIQQSDKAKSYAGENQQLYDKWLSALSYWNANLVQM